MRNRALLAAILALAVPGSGCNRAETSAPAAAAAATENKAVASAQQERSGGSECQKDPLGCEVREHPAPRVDGARALALVREIVASGPRTVGSPAHRQFGALLRKHLGDGVDADPFTVPGPRGKPAQLTNYIARFPGTSGKIVVLASHYDTKSGIPGFTGANDGGSSSGLLLEMGRMLQSEMRFGRRQGNSIWLVWFDGEEAFEPEMNLENSLFGSRRLAAKWKKDGVLENVAALILMDMVGDADLRIENEAGSTAWLNELVRGVGARLGYGSHFNPQPRYIVDDHVPFLQAGVAAVDLIDFEYGFQNSVWHTKDDTVDKLSARSLEVVGNTVMQTVWVLDARAAKSPGE